MIFFDIKLHTLSILIIKKNKIDKCQFFIHTVTLHLYRYTFFITKYQPAKAFRFSRFFFLRMGYSKEQILDKLSNSTVTDDIQNIATLIEYNVSKEEQLKLKKMLKELVLEKRVNDFEALSIKYLLDFLE